MGKSCACTRFSHYKRLEHTISHTVLFVFYWNLLNYFIYLARATRTYSHVWGHFRLEFKDITSHLLKFFNFFYIFGPSKKIRKIGHFFFSFEKKFRRRVKKNRVRAHDFFLPSAGIFFRTKKKNGRFSGFFSRVQKYKKSWKISINETWCP